MNRHVHTRGAMIVQLKGLRQLIHVGGKGDILQKHRARHNSCVTNEILNSLKDRCGAGVSSGNLKCQPKQ